MLRSLVLILLLLNLAFFSWTQGWLTTVVGVHPSQQHEPQRLNLQRHPDQPEWLSHVNASVLKVKLAMAIIGISSIHLLKTFIDIGTLGTEGSRYTEAGVMWQTIIHTIFILSAIGIAYTDKLMGSTAAKKH